MWRILDLRTGKYAIELSLLPIKNWELYFCLSWSEANDILWIWQHVKKDCLLDKIQTSYDKQELINQLQMELLDFVRNWNYKESWLDTLLLYINSCLIETIIEFSTKKKALLSIHQNFGVQRHFYEAVEI